jgi:hypothetical protein
MVNNLGVDSELWAARFGEGFTHSQLVGMEPIWPGQPHFRHPYSAARQRAQQAQRGAERAAHYRAKRAQQEAAQVQPHDESRG